MKLFEQILLRWVRFWDVRLGRIDDTHHVEMASHRELKAVLEKRLRALGGHQEQTHAPR